MTLTQRLREPLTGSGCVCCQGLAGAVAFVFGKCLCWRLEPQLKECLCSDFLWLQWLLLWGICQCEVTFTVHYFWLKLLEPLLSAAGGKDKQIIFKCYITFRNIHFLLLIWYLLLISNITTIYWIDYEKYIFKCWKYVLLIIKLYY